MYNVLVMAASTGIDRWLKGLDDMASANSEEIRQRLDQARDELDVVQLRISILEPLLERALAREAREQSVSDKSATPKTTDAAADAGTDSVAMNGSEQTGEADSSDARPPTWKTDAVLAVLRNDTHRMFKPRDVRDLLRAQGVLENDEGTPTSVILRRLADRGLAHVQDGRYGFNPPQTERQAMSFPTTEGSG